MLELNVAVLLIGVGTVGGVLIGWALGMHRGLREARMEELGWWGKRYPRRPDHETLVRKAR